MAKLQIVPPPPPVQRQFVLTLSEDEALHIWAALGPSNAKSRAEYIQNRRRLTHFSFTDDSYELYCLLDNEFTRKKGTPKTTE